LTRVAAIDLGTNTTRLLVADVERGEVDALVRRSTITRLGEGVDASRRLAPDAIGRVRAVLDGYREELEALGVERTLAVATSAVRDAANGREVLAELEEAYGWPFRLISGDEEAALTLRGVGALDDKTLVLDVGGGSTELITARTRTSLDLGSTRLTERFLHADPPAADELEVAGAHVRALLPPLAPTRAIGVAGTVAQLQELAGELTAEAVAGELRRLAALPLAERRLVPGLDPARAPVIVAGALIVHEVLSRYGLGEIGFSVRDLLDGAALGMA
jgi:exopolyphosphatase / guanosine-5'-triphosphate,3'-diphosphate pyrophosphatase